MFIPLSFPFCSVIAHRRSFADGDDPRWTALEKNDYTNNALQYYSDRLATTRQGYLNITTVAEDITLSATAAGGKQKLTKHFQSAMIQGWNKFCFVGGAVEISAKLPGKKHVGGLWYVYFVYDAQNSNSMY